MKYTIQPCPFCAGDMTEVVTDDSENFAVLCGDCQAQGRPAATNIMQSNSGTPESTSQPSG